MSLASGGSSGTRSTRGSVITGRKSLSRRYSAVIRVYTWPTRVCCCWGRRGSAIARTRQCLVARAVRLTLRGRATHEYSTERIDSALGLGCPWRLVRCVHHTTRITMPSSWPGRFRPTSGMQEVETIARPDSVRPPQRPWLGGAAAQHLARRGIFAF